MVKRRQPVTDLNTAAAPDKYLLQHSLKLDTLLYDILIMSNQTPDGTLLLGLFRGGCMAHSPSNSELHMHVEMLQLYIDMPLLQNAGIW